MKLMVKLCIFVLVLGLGAPFFLKGPGGKPLFSVDSFFGDVQSIPSKISAWWNHTSSQAKEKTDSIISGKKNQPTKVYKWQDSEGTWHYAESPNETGTSEEIWVDPNTNVVEAIKVPKKNTGVEEKSKSSDFNIPSPTTIGPNKIKQLVNDANNIQELIDKRAEHIEQSTH